MLVSIYKYIGDCGNGLIFTIPGRVLNVPGIDPDQWYLMGEYGVEEDFLDKCAEKLTKKCGEVTILIVLSNRNILYRYYFIV